MAYITLNKNNFFHNLDIIAQKTKSVDKIALVLKDNAYGHGLLEMAAMAKEYGIIKAVVRTEAEAQTLAHLFTYILVLADIPQEPHQHIRYTINDIESIEKFPKGTCVELKVDTGMHRNGIAMSELHDAFEKIKKTGLILEAVFTHHRSADELSSEWFWQNENFAKVKHEAKSLAQEFAFGDLRYHSANSASLLRSASFDEDMARVGIAAYGCMDLPEALQLKDLKSVLSLYAQKISSRALNDGESIGYGAIYEMQENSVVSNYDIGYADGFFRVLSNNYTTPQGLKLLGRVSMDNTTFLSDAEEILVFDDASKVAKSAYTISYEILTSLKSHLKRVVV